MAEGMHNGANGAEFFDHFRVDPMLEKLENASSRIGKLLTEQAALINEGSLDAAAAHTQFVPAALEILSDEGVPKEAVLNLADDHPLKTYFFCCIDEEMYGETLEPFVKQAQQKVGATEAWEAEAAVGEADGEDHTLE